MNDKAHTVDAGGAKGGLLCFVVDDEPAVGRFIAVALRASASAKVEQFLDIQSMLARLTEVRPNVVFLDVSLGDEDAVEALRLLAGRKFTGGIVLMTGWAAKLLNDVKRIGERRGLRMLPPLEKPFRLEAIQRTLDALDDEWLAPKAEPVANSRPGAVPQIDLGEALDKDWVELWYQPKLHLQERRLVGAEGLARIRHPELGVLKPESFANASDANLIRLAEVGLRKAVRDSAEFALMGRHLKLAVNIPVAALMVLPIADIVRQERRRGPWNGLLLEVTEEQIIHDIPFAHEIATQLRIHGVALTLDDFGTGYSSLERLADLPFTEIKLARTLVAGCSQDTARADLCRTVIEMAHRLGCEVVAEGLETTQDLAKVRQMGGDIGQGYLFAHAMPKEFLATRLIAQAPDGGFATIIDLAEDDERRAIA